MPHYWLLKSEPDEFGWDDLIAADEAVWDGIRNHQAANNLRAMAVGDHAFFYHSGPSAGKIGPHIVGICAITAPATPDPTDESGKWVVVKVRAVRKLPAPISLRAIRSDEGLANMALLRQSRLSVSPVTDHEWHHICDKANLRPER